MQFAAIFRTSLRSTAQQHQKRQRQMCEQRSDTVSRHKDCHCGSPDLPACLSCPVHPPEVADSLCGKQKFETKGRGMEIYFHLAVSGVYVENVPHPLYLRISRSELPALLLKGRSLLSSWFVMRLNWQIALGKGGGGFAKEGRKEIKPPSKCVVTWLGKGRGRVGVGGEVKKCMRRVHYQIGKRWKHLKIAHKISSFPVTSSTKVH